MNKIKLEIAGISDADGPHSTYALVLSEAGGNRRLPIIIGQAEAQAIAVAIERMTPIRPFTHDIVKSIADTFNITLTEVIINELREGVFHSKLVCRQGDRTVYIDSRTSDAIALAVRFGASIYTYENILDEAGLSILDISSEPDADEDAPVAKTPEPAARKGSTPSKAGLQGLSTDEIKARIAKALEAENYEDAAKLHEELKRREEPS